jgi:hypothetical protein
VGREADRAYDSQQDKHAKQGKQHIVEIAHEAGKPENAEQDYRGPG